MAEPTEFEIDGVEFQLSPLKVKAQLRAMALLAPIALGLAKESPGADALASLDRLPELVALMAERCTTTWDGKRLPLASFQDNVFERKPTLLLAWLAECVRIELGDFLDETGQSRIKAMVSKFVSRQA